MQNKNIKLFFILSCCFIYSSCDINQINEQANEEIFNSMTVTLNDSIYTLTSVYGEKANSLGSPFCVGYLAGNKLVVDMMLDDTVLVGSGVHFVDHDVTYHILYNGRQAIYNSGVIISERYLHENATRVRGTFNCKVANGDDTLNFTNGRFNVYLRPSDES